MVLQLKQTKGSIAVCLRIGGKYDDRAKGRKPDQCNR